MKIIIEYESAWRNSFLEGSNNEELPKKGRKFVGSMTSLRKPENYKQREVTIDTVMGVLNRLIGDQRKLYQARNEEETYFFKDLEPAITFDDVKSKQVITQEMTYIRNISGSTDQNSFTGAIKANDDMFSSDYSEEFWGILALDFTGLCDFIMNNTKVTKRINLNPIVLVEQIELLDKSKKIEISEIITDVVEKLNKTFPELITKKVPEPYVEKDGKIKSIRFYAAALYLQHERLQEHFDMSTAISSRGSISGFSKRGFNGKRDFMNRFTTGKPKKIWGNPYIRKERIKGIGEVTSLMTKASGQLEINIDIDRKKGKEIKTMIESAGVSSFYLGKKGLAYISKPIRV